ncbi:uncharacterized protein LOC135369079 [Ornithodoros turicata]|uniref:uncharacterized protein LOC135369079 n=1 Tax=Ornithodoros turicata TaxID=34597 RepID=UPI0031397F47
MACPPSARRSLAIVLLACATLVHGRCTLSDLSCGNGKCVSMNRYCDGSDDCGDGSDEPLHCTNCNRTYYGQAGTKYTLRMSEPIQRHLSFVCRLSFVAAGDHFGDLVEITFLSFQVGFFHLASNSTPSCIHGLMEVTEHLELKSQKARSTTQYSIEPMALVKERLDAYRTVETEDVSSKKSAVHFGGFCGSLVGRSATFYSAGGNVTVQMSFPMASSLNIATAGLFLTYRFLNRRSTGLASTIDSQRSIYYGESIPGTYCDRRFQDCEGRRCRIRSPNYPGFYLRNITCTYHVKQENSRPGHISQVVVRQDNEYKMSIHSGTANAGAVVYNALTTECASDVVRIFDGSPSEKVLLQEFCGSGTLPDVVSSGPELTVQLVSAPFQQLVESRMELDVHIRYEDKTQLRMSGRSCRFLMDSTEKRSGIVYTPKHSIPENTMCTFEFLGRSRFDRVWLYFTDYFVPDRQPWTSVNAEKCDVSQLEIYDTLHANMTSAVSLVGKFCEKSSPRVCSHAHDYRDLVPARPCKMSAESYLSNTPGMLIKYRVFRSSDITARTSSFTARYEFVDTSQNGMPVNGTLCDRIFRSAQKPRGRVASPKNVFLYGRGDSSSIKCSYHFHGAVSERLRLRIDKIYLATEGCSTTYDENQIQHYCTYPTNDTWRRRFGELRVTETWLGITIPLGCFCSNSTFLHMPLDLTSVGHDIVMTFTVQGMTVDEDFDSFGFEASYEFLPPGGCGQDRVLRGHVGDAVFASRVNHGEYRALQRCRWLLEASPGKFLYVQVSGGRESIRQCGADRLLVYSGTNLTHVTMLCALSEHAQARQSTEESGQDTVAIFSSSWTNGSQSPYRPERLVLETLSTEPTTGFRVRWMEVMRPFFTTKTGQTLRNVNCIHECPELDACISPQLWCDGEVHCPSGLDENPESCHRFPIFYVLLGCSAVLLLVMSSVAAGFVRQFKKGKRASEEMPMSAV